MAGHSRAPRSPSPSPHLWGGESRAGAGLPAGQEPGEANPFSFREFVRSQGRSAAPRGASPKVRGGGGDWRAPPPGPPARPPSPPAPSLPTGRRPPEPFFPEPGAGREEEAEEEDAEWSGCYQPAAVEQAHLAGPGSASPGPSPLEPFRCQRAGWSGPGDSAPWPPDERDPLGYASAGEAGEGPQPSFRELQEENDRLRSKVNQLHFFSETQTDRVKKLEKKLEENKIKEQKEAWDLEAMVQHVEQNLQLMTKRAVKAENNVIKLKQENALLQVQLKNYETENEALKTGQSASLAVVKQNADTALQNLLRVITNSRSSIKQLVSGAESLQVVAELLKSIDRISEISDDGL
ncbi:LOW QUALITY PROTEIN: endosome-associated-trafficking regulator 1 [Pangshura tecta]